MSRKSHLTNLFFFVLSILMFGASVADTGTADQVACVSSISACALAVGGTVGKIINKCKPLRQCKKVCRQEKRQCKKEARHGKRDCRQECKDKTGKQRRECTKACRQEKRTTAKECRKTRQVCKQECKHEFTSAACQAARNEALKIDASACATLALCVGNAIGKAAAGKKEE